MAELRLLNFKASNEEIANWDAAAFQTHHRNRSRWIRDTLNAALFGPKPVKEVPHPVVQEQVVAMAADLSERAVAKSKEPKSDCDRRIPAGTFCKECGKVHG